MDRIAVAAAQAPAFPIDGTPCPAPTAGAVRIQPSLFGELPELLDQGRAGRRARAAARQRVSPAADEAVTIFPVPVFMPPPPPPEPEPLNPAALSQAELRAFVQALPDSKLTFLLTEAARHLKRRILEGEPGEEDGMRLPPDPSLIRAAGMAVAELSGEDDCGDYGESRPPTPSGKSKTDNASAGRATRSTARRG